MTPDLARAFATLTTGIYVLTVADGETGHGMSVSWVTQVSGTPPLVLAAVGQKLLSATLIKRSGWFAINVIGRRQRQLEDYFYSAEARRPANLEPLRWEKSRHNVPVLCDAMINLVCRTVEQHDVGDRTLSVGALEQIIWREHDVPLTSQDLEYVYVGEVVHRDKRRTEGGG